MSEDTRRIGYVLDGWDGYHRSLVDAIDPLTTEQLAYRGCPDMRSVGELALHIADGRVEWFQRIDPAGNEMLVEEMASRPDGRQWSGAELATWLERTWQMVRSTLDRWTVDDLPVTYEQPYQGNVYAVSRQWVIFRILAHDIHHGGQLSELLAMQGIYPTNLTWLGGHITEPPLIAGSDS